MEETDGDISAIELKWNPKARVRFPATFLEAYRPLNTRTVNPENFDEWLLPPSA